MPQTKNNQSDQEWLLEYFQQNGIQKIELTSEGHLLIEYGSGKTETNDQINRSSELQKLIAYYQTSDQTSLSQQELINATMNKTGSTQDTNTNKKIIY